MNGETKSLMYQNGDQRSLRVISWNAEWYSEGKYSSPSHFKGDGTWDDWILDLVNLSGLRIA